MINYPADKLRRLSNKIFESYGLSKENAEFVSDTLVEASLTGHDSHGVRYLPRYVERIKQGNIRVDVEPEIIRETLNTVLIDGRWAFGQLVAKKLIELAVAKAKENMVSTVGAYNCNHIGRLGYYTSWAACKGIITLMFVNVGHPIVSVYNGFGKALGTNPFSVSVPTGNDTPFLVDYATSVVAAGKIAVARSRNQKLPKHWTKDKNGCVNEDPNVLIDGGWLLPFGEHKGYGLQMTSELLGAVLTGSRTGLDPIADPPSPNGTLVIALNPDCFVGLDNFKIRTTELLMKVKELPAVSGERVLIPGEPEKEFKVKRLVEGIPLPEEIWNSILTICDELKIDANTI
jgi:LDH2 family malate/lactate/ureidoglycolate dehydrogenase